MSWMDSWSRPSANSKVPAPLYLSGDNVPYCHTCGRVMSMNPGSQFEAFADIRRDSKKATKKQNSEIKYCSDRCRSRKPGPVDREIERSIATLLNGEKNSGLEKTAAKSRMVKGDPRLVVSCDEVEEIVFGSRSDPERTHGRKKNRKSRAIGEQNDDWKSVDMEDSQDFSSALSDSDSASSVDGGVHIRPPQNQSEVNFSVGGERGRAEKIEESADDLEKRRQGAKRAEEREMVRRAARRMIVFGLEVPREETTIRKLKKGRNKPAVVESDEERPQTGVRRAEALMNGVVVEPSYAKGNWMIRWRD